MSNKELIKILKIAIAEVEWEYPISYAAAFDKAIDRLQRLDKAIERLEKMYKEFCDDKGCKVCNKFYGRTLEILRGVNND